ncbi:hypothetical protein GH714_042117 [Hevea brasiliensis]|uniref:Uncharacterized protein n=1 Tax=Hevea brasiliensis TaxID=3981 RepID=A0A6A6MWQ6_HEVBR|nr:hypothetical protein GH714_042117 [Hevea brasiliensis]
MMLYDGFKEILKIQKFRRIVSYTGFYCFVAVLSYAYTSNTTRAGYSRADQFYASYPAGTELLTDTAKLYKAAFGNCFESEEWGPIEFCIMAKHFDRQGNPRMPIMHNIWHTFFLMENSMEVARVECYLATRVHLDVAKFIALEPHLCASG